MKIVSFILLTFLLILPSVSMGATETIIVRWQYYDDPDIEQYRVYFAYDIGMTDKKLAGQIFDPSTTELECSNVTLTEPIVYFILEAVKTDGTVLTSDPFEKIYRAPPNNLRIAS